MEKRVAKKELAKKLAYYRTNRLENASIATLTARTMVWRVREER